MVKRKTILIVDDELGVREFLSENLKQNGYEACTAADGREGFEAAFRIKPDLILLDVIMPVMDGWQMLSKLRAQDKTKNIPVVMLTAKSETESLFKSQERKVLDYFVKPVDSKELLHFVKRYVDLSETDS